MFLFSLCNRLIQRNCLYVALTANYKKGFIPKRDGFHKLCYSIITSTYFERAIYISIFINSAVLAVQHYHMSQTLNLSIYWINLGFTVLFTAEAILKLVILTPSVSDLYVIEYVIHSYIVVNCFDDVTLSVCMLIDYFP